MSTRFEKEAETLLTQTVLALAGQLLIVLAEAVGIILHTQSWFYWVLPTLGFIALMIPGHSWWETVRLWSFLSIALLAGVALALDNQWLWLAVLAVGLVLWTASNWHEVRWELANKPIYWRLGGFFGALLTYGFSMFLKPAHLHPVVTTLTAVAIALVFFSCLQFNKPKLYNGAAITLVLAMFIDMLDQRFWIIPIISACLVVIYIPEILALPHSRRKERSA